MPLTQYNHAWGLCCMHAVTLPGWYMSGSATNGTTNSNGSALIGFNSSTPMAYMFDRCPVNTYNNGGNLATACTACPYGTTTRYDPGMGYYWYSNGVDDTEDMCGAWPLHTSPRQGRGLLQQWHDHAFIHPVSDSLDLLCAQPITLLNQRWCGTGQFQWFPHMLCARP